MARDDKEHGSLIVAMRDGDVQGKFVSGIRAFIGIPYAAPPVGKLRFVAPQPVTPWSGMRDTTTAGPTAPQTSISFPRLDMPPIAGHGWTRGDDYLTLNVWTPAEAQKRPVMVWIHGGGGIVGNKDTPVSNGTGFARSGVVCVAINYRLGVEGFLPIPGAATNIALRDMIAALKWVQANIASFGGDPANVTVFGESGGGLNLAALVASPLAQGLFARAIIQSGHGSTAYPLAIAARTVDRVAKLLKISPDVEGFRNVDHERTLKAQAKVNAPVGLDLRDENGLDPGFRVGRFSAVYGDDVLPAAPLQALRDGVGRDIEVLIGTTAQEGNFWFIPTYLQWLLPGFVATWMAGKVMPNARKLMKAYGLGQRGNRGGAVFNRVLTDFGFRWPARQFAEAHQGRTHMFEFEWHSTACGGALGAAHGIDLPFTFDTLDVATGPRGIAGENPPQALADRMHGLWVRFATDGTLPWPEFDAQTRQVFQIEANVAIHEPVMAAAEFLPA